MSNSASSSKPPPDLPPHLLNNSNMKFISELRTITPDMTAKDLTEQQKRAFLAMMRMVHDPTEKTWTKRKEKQDRQKAARIGAELAKQPRESLKVKIKRMRTEGKFPLPSAGTRADQARRYGFIPSSQRKNKVEDYAKI